MKIIDTGTASAAANMAGDSELLKQLSPGTGPLLHFYEWEKPSATHGHFIDPTAYLLPNTRIDLARRPTGGGIIFHLTDLAFSVLVPADHPRYSLNTMENYHLINTHVVEAIRLFKGEAKLSLLPEEPTPLHEMCCGFCMAKPTRYDVMIEGKKAAGGAQRRTKNGFLHQGSICLRLPEENELMAFFKEGAPILESMLLNSYPVAGEKETLAAAKKQLKECLATAFSDF